VRRALSLGTLAGSKGARLRAKCCCALAQRTRVLSCGPRARLKRFLLLPSGTLYTVDVSFDRRDDVMDLVLAAVDLAGDAGGNSSAEHEEEDYRDSQQLHG
jgi:hypothetical protein